MNLVEKELTSWAEGYKGFALPRWEELPDLDLYMDQVISFTHKHLKILNSDTEKLVTANMVNNYVKQKLIPAPHKKRYNRTHLAYLIAITVLKHAFSLNAICNGIDYQMKLSGRSTAYNIFCEEFERTLANLMDAITHNKPIVLIDERRTDYNTALILACNTIVCKMIAEKSIETQANININEILN